MRCLASVRAVLGAAVFGFVVAAGAPAQAAPLASGLHALADQAVPMTEQIKHHARPRPRPRPRPRANLTWIGKTGCISVVRRVYRSGIGWIYTTRRVCRAA